MLQGAPEGLCHLPPWQLLQAQLKKGEKVQMQKQKELEQEAKRMAEERRKYTLKVLGVAMRIECKEECT